MKRFVLAAALALASSGMANAERAMRNPPEQPQAAAALHPASPDLRDAQVPSVPQFDYYDNQPRSYGRWQAQQYNTDNGGA